MGHSKAPHHPLTWGGMLVTLGIIFGDIGTSPLYVFKAIMGETTAVSELLVLGSLSCIIWTLTLQTTLKYIIITLRADNKGEGGIFSLYTLVRRYGKWVYIPAMVGAATLLADGILTPPISVASAIEGLGGVDAFEDIIAPGNTTTVAIVMAIISFLFFFQRFGTKVVGLAFGPIMFVWFSMLLVLGLAQVLETPAVLQSLNPVWAVRLLTEYPEGFWLLGAVFLCTTGAEGLYNDMGHCGRQNIQATWTFVKTALVLNYMGQAGWLLQREGLPLGHDNPFYGLMPQGFLLIGVAVATLAAVVACQAVISGSFTLINEAISLNFWPRVLVKFPTEVRGQIYIPSINWILWAGCMGVMIYFRSSGEMEAAYGFFIVVAMLMTTLLLFGYLRFNRKWPLLLVFMAMGLFLTLEGANFVANVVKIIHRPYLVLAVALLLGVMMMWYRGRKITNRFLDFIPLADHAQALRDLSDDKEITKYATHLVYLTKANSPAEVEKHVIDSILARKVKRADIYWFVHVNYTDSPYTMEYQVRELIDDKVIRVDFNLGFRVQPRINKLFRRVLEELEADHELEFRSKYESIKKGDFHTDICYVLTERVLSVENEFNFRKDAILDIYYFLKGMALHDREAFGLEPNNTVVEQVPLVLAAAREMPLRRVGPRAHPTDESTKC
jgi:KUP system potassium uptake protein